MVKSCAAFSCSNRNDVSSKNRSITFHRLPISRPDILKLWIHNIQRKNLPINKHTVICSQHFEPTCFIITASVNTPKKVSLANDAVPTIFNLPPSIRTPSTSKRRRLFSRANLSTSDNNVLAISDNDNTEDIVADTPNEIDMLKQRIVDLERENVELKLTVYHLQRSKFCVENICNDNSLFRFYTGLDSYETFKQLLAFLGPAQHDLLHPGQRDLTPHSVGKTGRTKLLTTENQLFLTLCRLRLGMLERDLSWRFGINIGTVSLTVRTWICLISARFKSEEVDLWPPMTLIKKYLPACFSQYPNTAVILDCTEIFIDKPTNPIAQQQTWSSYKNHNTLKALVGITPAGAISFVSTLYGGNTSDREMVRLSGILEKLEPGTSVMADRGFTIEDLLVAKGVTLNIPPFLQGRSQLSALEVLETRKIASVRIHVERAIGRIKTFRILDYLPLSLIPISDELFFTCAMLTNFLPLLRD